MAHPHAAAEKGRERSRGNTAPLCSREGLACVCTPNTPFPQAHTSVWRRASTNTASSDVTATEVYGVPGKSSRTAGRGSTAPKGPPSAGQGLPLAPRLKHGGHQAQTESSRQSWGPGGARESWSPHNCVFLLKAEIWQLLLEKKKESRRSCSSSDANPQSFSYSLCSGVCMSLGICAHSLEARGTL